MFLPRASASASTSSSSKPDSRSAPHSGHASVFSHSPKRYAIKSSQGAAWSQPTTAPPSVQVHYHYLAGRYRDLSNERGLGLSSSGMPSSSSMATLGGILEGDHDEANSMEGDARSINLQPSPNGKSQSASSSLRAIARKTGVGSKKEEGSSGNRLQDLFASGGIGEGKYKEAEHASSSPRKADWQKGETIKGIAAPHGGKHASLRSYAEERIKAQEVIEARIQQATDTGRLKWEARAAMLNSSFALAILLYIRAAQLGSISAALSLSHLYASGLTRGNKPVVVLIHRDPLRSLAWGLEANRLLRKRTKARADMQGASSMHWSKTESEQPAQIVALFARLLRCRQMAITAKEDVKLPAVRKQRLGKEREAAGTVWTSVCESMEWLVQHLTASVRPSDDTNHSIGPDDDEDDPAMIKANQAHTHVALVEALVATKRVASARQEDEKVLSQVATCWKKFADALRSESVPHDPAQGSLEILCTTSEKLSSGDFDARKGLEELAELLDKSLVESAIAVATSASETTFAHLESPSKRAVKQQTKRRASLEELMPIDACTLRKREKARRPSLLRHQPPTGETKPTTTLAFGEAAPASMSKGSGRSISLQGSGQRPAIPSRTSMAHLELLSSLHPHQQDKRTLQRARRPSSVMSASPSLLFTSKGDEEDNRRAETADKKDIGLPATSSVVSSLWKAAPLHSRQLVKGKNARIRVVSQHSAASVAPSEKIHTSGTTTDAYDIDVALSRQQTRRRRGDSNASISTLASMLSTNASVSASVTGSEYARGEFLSPSSSSSNFTGFDLRVGGAAADSLRRIRKASMTNQMARDVATTPHLSDTLEDIIANSASYRAVNAKAAPPVRKRRDSNASMKSLTAFTGNSQRQTSYGDMRPPSLFQGRASSVLGMPLVGADRGSSAALRSPTLSMSTSYFNVTSLNANGTVQSRSRAPSQGAVGSLRLLGRQSSSQSEPKTTISDPALASKDKQDKVTNKSAKQPFFPSLGVAASTLIDSPKVPGANHHQRAFEAFDPTHLSSRLHSQSASPAGSIYNGKSKPSSDVSSSSNGNLNNSISALDPALAQAEERSGLKTTSACIVCHHKVVNAPVTKSGDVFCSRDCRLEMKRKRTAEAKGKTRDSTSLNDR